MDNDDNDDDDKVEEHVCKTHLTLCFCFEADTYGNSRWMRVPYEGLESCIPKAATRCVVWCDVL